MTTIEATANGHAPAEAAAPAGGDRQKNDRAFKAALQQLTKAGDGRKRGLSRKAAVAAIKLMLDLRAVTRKQNPAAVIDATIALTEGVDNQQERARIVDAARRLLALAGAADPSTVTQFSAYQIEALGDTTDNGED